MATDVSSRAARIVSIRHELLWLEKAISELTFGLRAAAERRDELTGILRELEAGHG